MLFQNCFYVASSRCDIKYFYSVPDPGLHRDNSSSLPFIQIQAQAHAHTHTQTKMSSGRTCSRTYNNK